MRSCLAAMAGRRGTGTTRVYRSFTAREYPAHLCFIDWCRLTRFGGSEGTRMMKLDWRAAPQRRLSRRGAIKAGTASAIATVVIAGAPELRPRPATASSAGETALATRALGERARLVSVDPHATAGLWSLLQESLAQPAGPPRLRIVPIDRAKFLVGQRFDLRVEAEGVDPTTA